MKRNFNVQLTNLAGEPITEEGANRPLLAKTIALNALLNAYEDERDLAGEEKVRRYNLAKRIYADEGETELTIEEAGLLKKLVGKAYVPLVVGQMFAVLEAE